MGDGTSLRLAANLSADEITLRPDQIAGAAIWGSGGDRLPAWSVCWRIASGEMSA
jgi:hypothetical protein